MKTTMEKSPEERLSQKFGEIPKWAEDFPIESTEESAISRRDLIRFLALVSFGLFTGTVGVFLRSLKAGKKTIFSQRAIKVMDAGQIAVGESAVIELPGKKEKGIVIRRSRNEYVAYSQKCTHLSCPVLWDVREYKLICPCHRGAFSIEDGRPLYGPPERPLPKLDLQVREDGVYFVGA